MSKLLHIRVGKEIKDKMQKLLDAGLFENQAEITREAIRSLLLKYSAELELEQKKAELKALEEKIKRAK